MMVRAVDQGTSPEIWNGYQELETPELRILKTYPLVAVDGRLVSQYPPFFAQIAWPFYALFGFWGLFLLNLLLYPVTVWATWRIGDWLDGPRTAMALRCAMCWGPLPGPMHRRRGSYAGARLQHHCADVFFLALEGRRWLGLVAGVLVGIAVGALGLIL